jgi:hypothetical protein
MLACSKARLNSHRPDGTLYTRITDFSDCAAPLAYQVMVVLIRAHDIGAAALVGVQTIEHAKLHQQVESSKDGRPTD